MRRFLHALTRHTVSPHRSSHRTVLGPPPHYKREKLISPDQNDVSPDRVQSAEKSTRLLLLAAAAALSVVSAYIYLVQQGRYFSDNLQPLTGGGSWMKIFDNFH